MNHVLCVVTGSVGDARRARRLLGGIDAQVTYYDVDRSRSRTATSKDIWNLLASRKWHLVFQEGTGIAGGLNLIRAATTRRQRYVVSSGDPVGDFFRTTQGPLLGYAFEVYERALYRNSSAFIGWTPYLSGMALRMGAPRVMTAEGAVDLRAFSPASETERSELRNRIGIPEGHLVCGMVGSLKWTARQHYCYGLELVEILKRLRRSDVTMLIVGDGDGRSEIERRIPDDVRGRFVFTGHLPPSGVAQAMKAMDLGFVVQSGRLGAYRLTTKLPEYLAAGLPVAMTPSAGFYDYVHEAGWALSSSNPTSEAFHRENALWLDELSRDEVFRRAKKARNVAEVRFDYDVIAARVTSFLNDILRKSLIGSDPT